MKIDRTDIKYKEIENFKSYELTNCICWEMAKRNKVVQDTFSILDRHGINQFTNQMYIYLKGFFFIDYLYIILFYQNNSAEKEHIKKLYLKYFDLEKNRYVKKNDTANINIKIEKSKIFQKVSIYVKKEKSKKLLGNYIVNIFSRPQLHIPLKFKIYLPDINISLPDEEFMNYLKELRNSKLIRSKSEITDRYKSNSNLIYKTSRKNERAMNIDDVIASPKKCADMFFIYDAYKLNMKQSEIKQSIDYYYEDKTIDATKTLVKYHELAKEYIDNVRYKELISGIDMIHCMNHNDRIAYNNIQDTNIFKPENKSLKTGILKSSDGKKIEI